MIYSLISSDSRSRLVTMAAATQSVEKEEEEDVPRFKNVHVWIGELLGIPEHPSGVSTFNIMGTVVDCISPGDLESGFCSRPVRYKIDDGTGVITAVQFLQNRIRKQNDRKLAESLVAGGSSAEKCFAEKVRKTFEASRSSYEIGTIVEAKGKLQHFRGDNELLAFSVREVRDMSCEIERTILMEKIKKDGIYPKTLFHGK